MNLYEHQLAVVNDTSRYVLAGWGRGTGKTTTITSLIENPSGKVLVIFQDNATLKSFAAMLKSLNLYKAVEDGRVTLIESTASNFVLREIFEQSYDKVILDEPGFIKTDVLIDSLKIDSKQTYFIGTPRPLENNRLDGFLILYRLREVLGISYHKKENKLLPLHLADYMKEMSEEYYKTDILALFPN